MTLNIDAYWFLSAISGATVVICSCMIWVVRTFVSATKTWTLVTKDLEDIKASIEKIESQNEISKKDLQAFNERISSVENNFDMRISSIESKVILRIEMIETLKRCEQFFEKLSLMLEKIINTRIEPPDLTGPIIQNQHAADQKIYQARQA